MGLKFDFMKKASVISIGDEIVYGQTPDTNSAYLSGKLLSIGMPVVSIYIVGDDIDLIVQKLNQASDNADVVLLTGGLGPTDDDLTREALARFLGVELRFQDELLQKIDDFFVRRNQQMPARNKYQAYIPAGAKALANNLGTAPGIMAEVKGRWQITDGKSQMATQELTAENAELAEKKLKLKSSEVSASSAVKKGKLFIAMPGVPSEMKQMFEESVLTELKKLASEQTVVVRKLKCFGAGESSIAEKLGELMRRDRNPLINCTAEYGVITLHIIATAEEKNKAEQMAEEDEKLLTKLLGKLIYGRADQTLGEVVGEKLARQKKTIAVAESCTGGCLAKLLTDVPGASRYFTYGWITYTQGAKTSELDVKADLIEKHGAVSEQVAEAMAKGARKRAGADFAIGITGIAGPTGGSEQKPIGLIYIAIDSDNSCETKRFIIAGDRETIRLRAVQTALNMLRLKLET